MAGHEDNVSGLILYAGDLGFTELDKQKVDVVKKKKARNFNEQQKN